MEIAIGERVRRHRQRLGLTQAALAARVGRSERWLIEVEAGAVDLRLSDAGRLAGALGVELEELARGPAAALAAWRDGASGHGNGDR